MKMNTIKNGSELLKAIRDKVMKNQIRWDKVKAI